MAAKRWAPGLLLYVALLAATGQTQRTQGNGALLWTQYRWFIVGRGRFVDNPDKRQQHRLLATCLLVACARRRDGVGLAESDIHSTTCGSAASAHCGTSPRARRNVPPRFDRIAAPP